MSLPFQEKADPFRYELLTNRMEGVPFGIKTSEEVGNKATHLVGVTSRDTWFIFCFCSVFVFKELGYWEHQVR